jgi:hypothetical protein
VPQEKLQAYHRTAHYLTSRLPDKDSMLGKFTSDANTFKTSSDRGAGLTAAVIRIRTALPVNDTLGSRPSPSGSN